MQTCRTLLDTADPEGDVLAPAPSYLQPCQGVDIARFLAFAMCVPLAFLPMGA